MGKNKNSRKKSQSMKILLANDFECPYKFHSYFFDAGLKGKSIYAIKFNPYIFDRKIFATVAENRVYIFECVDDADEDEDEADGSDNEEKLRGIKTLLVYNGGSKCSDKLYSLAWSYDETSQPTLAFGGEDGIVRHMVITMDGSQTLQSLLGHTGPINDMKVQPNNHFNLLTAGADFTIRLWNMKTFCCIAVFAGLAHNSQIISIDCDPQGNLFVAGGMDHKVSVWSLSSPQVNEAIDRSQRSGYTAIRVYNEEYLVGSLHKNYVDSVVWLDTNSFFSRSADGEIYWWKAGSTADADTNFKSKKITKLLKVKDNDPEGDDQWFVRMQVDNSSKYLAIGHFSGYIFLWDLESASADGLKRSTISHNKNSSTITMVSFSNDDSILIACTESGKILRFGKK